MIKCADCVTALHCKAANGCLQYMTPDEYVGSIKSKVVMLASALQPFVDSDCGSKWVWPESAKKTALKNAREAITASGMCAIDALTTAESRLARLVETITQELDASEPQPMGGQHVGPMASHWNMTITTREAIRRLLAEVVSGTDSDTKHSDRTRRSEAK
jgi:hypothetical protein